ncbi:MAG: ornithine carbamoyltransferase [Pseudomonadota bacterium]
MARSFLTMNDITRDNLFSIFDKIESYKEKIKKGKELHTLKTKVVGILFEKPSTRTRTSFEAAILRLGGSAIYLSSENMQLKRGEPIKDTARILGSYVDALVARVYAHDTVIQLAEYSGIPVINGLSDLTHPTQVVCDLFTVKEVKGKLEGLTMAYIGDGNNMCNSLFLICAMTGMNMNAACPNGYHPDEKLYSDAKKMAEKTGAKLNIFESPKQAATGANVLYTDVWVSMGEDAEKEKRLKDFQGYQINAELLKVAVPDASVMHCLPAHRGLEITDDVLEGPQSIVWQQGANKMYGAAGILDFMMG